MGGGFVDRGEEWLCGAYAAGMGQEGLRSTAAQSLGGLSYALKSDKDGSYDLRSDDSSVFDPTV